MEERLKRGLLSPNKAILDVLKRYKTDLHSEDGIKHILDHLYWIKDRFEVGDNFKIGEFIGIVNTEMYFATNQGDGIDSPVNRVLIYDQEYLRSILG